MEQEDQGFGENTLRWGKPVGESETVVLGELISLKDSKIPRRNEEITNESFGRALTVVLEKRRVKRSEGVNSVRVYEPAKTG
jgi:hypothetical protein